MIITSDADNPRPQSGLGHLASLVIVNKMPLEKSQTALQYIDRIAVAALTSFLSESKNSCDQAQIDVGHKATTAADVSKRAVK